MQALPTPVADAQPRVRRPCRSTARTISRRAAPIELMGTNVNPLTRQGPAGFNRAPVFDNGLVEVQPA